MHRYPAGSLHRTWRGRTARPCRLARLPIAMLCASAAHAAPPGIPGSYEDFLDVAHAVIIARIESVDMREAAYDGPAWVTARIRKNLDGTLADGEPVTFAESSVGRGPRCRPGQFRILILVEDTKAAVPAAPSAWRAVLPIPRRGGPSVLTGFFIGENDLPAIDSKSLRAFLRELDESGSRPQRVDFVVPAS